MKIPSRAKLEKELARLKRAAEIRTRSAQGPSSLDLRSSFFRSLFTALRQSGENFAEFFQGLIPNPRKKRFPSPPRLLGSHDIALMIQVASEEPKFFTWFMYLRDLPQDKRIRELERMAEAMRLDPDNDDLAEILDGLHAPSVYEGFCQVLHDEQKLKHA